MVKATILTYRLRKPSMSFKAIKWLKRARNGLKRTLKRLLRKVSTVKPTAYIATLSTPNNFAMANASSS